MKWTKDAKDERRGTVLETGVLVLVPMWLYFLLLCSVSVSGWKLSLRLRLLTVRSAPSC
jgi:hypothetical protein